MVSITIKLKACPEQVLFPLAPCLATFPHMPAVTTLNIPLQTCPRLHFAITTIILNQWVYIKKKNTDKHIRYTLLDILDICYYQNDVTKTLPISKTEITLTWILGSHCRLDDAQAPHLPAVYPVNASHYCPNSGYTECEEVIITQHDSLPHPQQTSALPIYKGNNSHVFLNVDIGSRC